jgi:hypothetical protein
MHGILRVVATLLLFTMALGLPGAQAMPSVAPAGHAAGCHGHEPATPSPVPTSYRCCVNGHHAAIPNLSFSLRVVAAQVGSLDSNDGPRLASPLRLNSSLLVFPSDSPPSAAPLRI